MSIHQLHSFSKLSLTKSKPVNPITRSTHQMSTFTKTTRPLFSSDVVPLHSRLPIPKTLTSLLPKLSFRGIASGPTPPGRGPILARVMSDPTFYKQADTEAKVAIEKAIAEEKLEMYFATAGSTVVHKGPLPAMPADSQGMVPKEHTALWYVLHEDDKLRVVYVYAHAEAAEENKYMLALMQVMEKEVQEADRGGRLRDGKVFVIAQAGMGMSFFEYRGGGLQDVGFGGT